MQTYTALIKARVGSQIKAVPTQIRATNASDARWLLQAVYGFHALISAPMLVKQEMAEDFPKPPPSPEQAKIQSLKAAKDRAATALDTERDRQKRSKAVATLQGLQS
jgi:hypothetical protein